MSDLTIRILLIEDDPGDAFLIEEYLLTSMKVPYEVKKAERLHAGIEALAAGRYDIVLVDLGLPDGQDLDSFLKVHHAVPSVPVIVLTGRDDDQVAIRAVQEGAQDYLVKGQVNGSLLVRSIRYAIERQKLIMQVARSNSEIKVLRGFLPICAACKKIRDDKGYWKQLEAYISEHSEAEFSHGICPACAEKAYGEFRKILNKNGPK